MPAPDFYAQYPGMNEVPLTAKGPMHSSPKISIALATYNGARFVAEQLESYACQSVLPAELVVTDDGSSDATLDIVRAFAAHAPFPVRVECNPERLGFKANFLRAASLCQSELIAFSDQDDVWLPQKIETCQEAFADPNTLLAYHNATVATETLEPIAQHNHSPPPALNPPRSLDPWLFTGGFSMVFRRDLLRFNDLWPRSTDYYMSDRLEPHDQWIFFLASCLGNIRYLPAPLVLYRQHYGNTIGWIRPSSGLQNHWRNILSTQTAAFKSRQQAAEKRAILLEEIQLRLDGDQSNRAKLAAFNYRKLAAIYHLRQRVYESGPFPAKVKALLTTIRMNGYRPKNQWGVGRRALVRDLIRGVLLPARSS